MIDFNTLNQQQSNAVTALFGKIKIVAGAGSGKTRVLATRYAYLTETIGIDSNNILCLTFTNKAAQEMKRRILSMISNSAIINDFICTIHGFCVKFLRQEIYRLGYPKTFNIIDNEDSKGYAKKIMEQFGQDRSVQTVKQFLTNINRQKNILRSDYIPLMLSGATLKEDNEFEMYLREQLKTFSLDFNDLIHFTTYILNKFSDVREKWQEQFNFIMVDEVQDCNLSDWEIITILSARHGNLFIVGDPDQAIYEWRGAKPELFVQFSSDQQIILNENYRSTKNILDIANSVITNNDNRIQKDLFTRKKKYQHAIYFHGHSEIEEATWVVNNIKDAIQRDVKPQDIAILYRASHNSRIFEQQLIKEQVPYTIWGGIRFFERKEIKDIIAYLKLIINLDDDISFMRIVNVPSRKFGPKRLTFLSELSHKEGHSLMKTLKQHVGEKPFENEDIKRFIELITKYNDYKGKGLINLINGLLEDSGLKQLYRNDEDEERLENINELLESIHFYEKEHFEDEDFSIVNYLQDIALFTNADYRQDSSTVKLMTIHQAKGLEFPYIYIVALTEGLFPSHRSIRERKQKALEEERRLMYVAITRAKTRLFLTESGGYSYTTGDKYPSRFITEIKDKLLNFEGDFDTSLFENTRLISKNLDIELYGVSTTGEFKPGTFVKNPVLGIGEVIENYPDSNSCKVKFSNITIPIHYPLLTIITIESAHEE